MTRLFDGVEGAATPWAIFEELQKLCRLDQGNLKERESLC
jgi:hypothetical protein